GTYYFRVRIESPTLGRLSQQDFLRFRAGDADFYRLEFNGPNSHVDWLGLMTPAECDQAYIDCLKSFGLGVDWTEWMIHCMDQWEECYKKNGHPLPKNPELYLTILRQQKLEMHEPEPAVIPQPPKENENPPKKDPASPIFEKW